MVYKQIVTPESITQSQCCCLGEVCSEVWVHNVAMPTGTPRKLHCPWSGPFEIIEPLLDVTHRVKKSDEIGTPSIMHFNRLKLYWGEPSPLRCSPLPNSPLPDSQPPASPLSSPTFGRHLTLQIMDAETPEVDENSGHQESAATLPLTADDDTLGQEGGSQQQATHHYPQRTRRPPDRLIDHVHLRQSPGRTHKKMGCYVTAGAI